MARYASDDVSEPPAGGGGEGGEGGEGGCEGGERGEGGEGGTAPPPQVQHMVLEVKSVSS